MSASESLTGATYAAFARKTAATVTAVADGAATTAAATELELVMTAMSAVAAALVGSTAPPAAYLPIWTARSALTGVIGSITAISSAAGLARGTVTIATTPLTGATAADLPG